MIKPTFFISHYVVVYDVKDNRRGLQLLNILRSYLYQQQYSVFEGELTEKQCIEMKQKIKTF